MKTQLIMLLFIFNLLITLPSVTSDLKSDRAALISLQSALGGRTLHWNVTQLSPCQWVGVYCDGDKVTALRLPGASLSGPIPSGSLGKLTSLRVLSLRFNGLTGPLPEDLNNCLDLRNVYLQGNKLSGSLPEFLFKMHALIRLDLAGNSFSGGISSRFNSLNRLRMLYLDNNRLAGSLPELKLPNLGQFNVSFNQLNGSVPLSLRSMPEDSFLGNSLCGHPLKSCPVLPATAGGITLDESLKKPHKLSAGAIVGIVVGCVVGFALFLAILLIFCRKGRSKSKNVSSIDAATLRHLEAGTDVVKPVEDVKNHSEIGNVVVKKLMFFGNAEKVFDLEDLLRASAEVLGKGTFGTVYKASLEAGIVVAVKRLKDVSVSEDEFKEKIEKIGGLDHENLAPVRAYYYSAEEKLLVYDYMPKGSLSALLHGNKSANRSPLSWETRLEIALGTSRGVECIHSQGPDVSHGNIKSSNILLTTTCSPRLSDFGVAHLVGPTSTPNRVAGYRAPEVTDPRKVSQKADVYSFGVVLLELLTGKAPTHTVLNEDGVDLPRWVQSIVRDEWTKEVFDRNLHSDDDSNVDDEMVQLLQIGIDCVAQNPDNRPNMPNVVRLIEVLRQSSSREDHGSENDIVREPY